MSELALYGGAPASAGRIRLASPRVGDGYADRLNRIMSSGVLREDRYTREFEERFSRRVGSGQGFAVCNGTAALQLAYMSVLKPGDEVIVPAFTFEASAGAAVKCGVRPVYADVERSSMLLDVDALKEIIGRSTKAVLPVHLFGNVVDLRSLSEVAEDHGLLVIGDCCQAIGSRYMGRELGGLHDVCCYSFYPSKVITTAEGGMVTSNSPDIAHRVRGHKYGLGGIRPEDLGVNFRFDDVRAALGLDQLEMLDGFLAGRRRAARLLDAAVRGLGCVTPQRVEPWVESCYNYYTVRLDLDVLRCSRDLFVEALSGENIECGVYYPSPLTRHPLLRDGSTCPNAEELSRCVLSLPIHPFLGEREIEAVAEALDKVVSHFLR